MIRPIRDDCELTQHDGVRRKRNRLTSVCDQSPRIGRNLRTGVRRLWTLTIGSYSQSYVIIYTVKRPCPMISHSTLKTMCQQT